MQDIAARKLVQTPVGLIAIATSDIGIMSIDFLNSRSKLKDFSDSAAAQRLAQNAAGEISEYFARGIRSFTVPLDISGTEFQMKVWKQIQKIPLGKTVSYGEIARAIGKPRAARAVGGAVGANPVPIVIGCHRVMGSLGQITGYSGGSGITTKKKLLDLEGISLR
jgi:methylated-DNA-[protein]-cysteine S-methyltransferase